MNYKKLIIKSHVLYIFNMYIKFHSNQMLFIIQLINLFFIRIIRSQKFEILIFFNDITINFFILLKFCKHGGYNKHM